MLQFPPALPQMMSFVNVCERETQTLPAGIRADNLTYSDS